MSRVVVQITCILSFCLIPVLRADAGCCFIWKKDATLSSCAEDVDNADACSQVMDDNGCNRYHYFEPGEDQTCKCDGFAKNLPSIFDGDKLKYRYIL